MNLRSWLKEYKSISNSLPLNFSDDSKAAKLLSSLTKKDDSKLLNKLRKKQVIILANTLYLKKDLKSIEKYLNKLVVIAVDGAVKTLLENNIIPDINVTDLDGDANSIIKANNFGCLTVVHAHGDNLPKIKKIMPLLKGKVVSTTQGRPIGKVHNFYGFTDGDRATSLAVYFKAKPILLYAFKFYENNSIKTRKLQVGKHLIEKYAKTYKSIYDVGINESNLSVKKLSILKLEKLLKNG